MTDFSTGDAVDAFIAEHGIEPLRNMLANNQLAGIRKSNVELAVARYEAIERARDQGARDDLARRATVAAELQADHARRAADAAEASAQQAKRAADHARTAWLVAVIAIVVSLTPSVVAWWKR